ncbi:hypothetical protein FD754_024815, partial [Muntiacus muntjak]
FNHLCFLFQQKYGDVFTVYLGLAIREALVDQAEAFSGRAKIAVVDPNVQGYGKGLRATGRGQGIRMGMGIGEGEDFGMGKRSVEERIQEEAQCLVEELRKSQGALQDPIIYFHSITANIICSIVFGKRFDYRDPELLRLLELFLQLFVLISSLSSQLFDLYPSFLKYVSGLHRQIYKNLQEINVFTGRSVEKHRETLNPNAPRDFIDCYLLRMEKDKSDPQSQFDHRNLITSVLSLFFAGTETTSTTFRYGFLLMLKYPHIAGASDPSAGPE